MTSLAEKRCTPCTGDAKPLSREEAEQLRKKLRPEWTLADDANSIAGEFQFKDYWRTTAFVNAAAWIAHREDHHPDITFGYKTCRIVYWTHAVGGLTENDFICAAKVDALLAG